MYRRLLIPILLLALSGCVELLTGAPVPQRARCRGPELTNAADSSGTWAAGSVYAVVYCDGVTYTDTIR